MPSTPRRTRLVVAAVAPILAALTLLSPAHATPVPPTASAGLVGTWVNTNPEGHVAQVVISPDGAGGIDVDAFGRCEPTPCELGSVPAIVYGPSVGSTTGTEFQAKLSGPIAERTMFGRLVGSASGPRLSFAMWSAYTDGSGRHNLSRPETFVPGEDVAPTSSAPASTSYPPGLPPKLKGSILGTWVTSQPAVGVAKVVISGPVTRPSVEPFVVASGDPVSIGKLGAVTYGPSIGASRGSHLLAATTFSFKRVQLTMSYLTSGRNPRLSVAYYNEFTDGSGRSNYVEHVTLVRETAR